MPTPINASSGSIGTRKTSSKYGGPTEILREFSASMNSGYKVPSRIRPSAAIRNTLLNSRKVSRDVASKPAADFSARRAPGEQQQCPADYRRQESEDEDSAGGIVANACTEINTPERTRKVPSSDSEKAVTASSSVQLLKSPRFSVTANE